MQNNSKINAGDLVVLKTEYPNSSVVMVVGVIFETEGEGWYAKCYFQKDRVESIPIPLVCLKPYEKSAPDF